METFNSSKTQQVFPTTSLDESGVGCEIETDLNLNLDMRDTHLNLKLQLFRGRLFDAFKNEKSENKANSKDDSDEEPETYLNYVNNLLHSQFSNSKVSMAYNVNGSYPHKAQTSSDSKMSALSKKRILARQGYSFEEYTDAFDMHPFTNRANALGTGVIFSFYGRLTIDLFTCKILLLPIA